MAHEQVALDGSVCWPWTWTADLAGEGDWRRGCLHAGAQCAVWRIPVRSAEGSMAALLLAFPSIDGEVTGAEPHDANIAFGDTTA